MKVMIFLGSGVSYPSGMPSVADITEALLHGTWSRHSDGTYYQGENPSPGLAEQELARPEQQALMVLVDLISPYLQRNDPSRKAHYEDLFYILRQLREESGAVVGNPAVGPFFEKAKKKLRPALRDLSARMRAEHEYEVDNILGRCLEFIQDVVHDRLSSPESSRGLEFLGEILLDRDVSQLVIVTLNHDLLIEEYLKECGIGYVDGFGLDQDGYVSYSPDLLEGSAKVKLLKLHGSVDWYSVKTKSGYRVVRQSSRRGANPLNPRPAFLCGTDNKPLEYAFGVFQDLHYFWQRELDGCNLIVMSGYGWSDSGISSRLITWLGDPANKLALLARDVEDIQSNSNISLYYHNFIARDKIVLMRKWLADASWLETRSRIVAWDERAGLTDFELVVRKACEIWSDLDFSARDVSLRSHCRATILEIFKRCEVLENMQVGVPFLAELRRLNRNPSDFRKFQMAVIQRVADSLSTMSSVIAPSSVRKCILDAFRNVYLEQKGGNEVARHFGSLWLD